MKSFVKLSLTALVLMNLVSCGYRENLSGIHWFLDMHDSYAVEAQEEDLTTIFDLRKDSENRLSSGVIPSWTGPGSSSRVPPEGTVARNMEPYFYTDFETAGKELINPLEKTEGVYLRGQKMYGIYCSVCHGNTGIGDGNVVPKFSLPVPNLITGNAKMWPDGQIYHIMTVGRASMASYSAQLPPEDRWAVIHYIRKLQKN